MRATFLLADWSEALGGKVYAQGIGWNIARADKPISYAFFVVLHVAYSETNLKHSVEIALLDEDDKPFPELEPLNMSVEFEVGRPPGMRKGEESNIPFSARADGMVFKPGGYVFKVKVDETLLATYPITAKEFPP